MKFRGLFLLLGLHILASELYGQPDIVIACPYSSGREIPKSERITSEPGTPVEIQCTVSEAGTKIGVPGAPVILIENSDTLLRQETDVLGEVVLHAHFSREKNYHLVLDLPHQISRKNWIHIHAAGDSLISKRYTIDLLKLKLLICRINNPAVYAKKEIRNPEGFDVEFLKKVLAEHPQLCIEFVQVLHPEEKPGLARRRMRSFQKMLKREGVNLDELRFSRDVSHRNSLEDEDVRARIEPLILSNDGRCP